MKIICERCGEEIDVEEMIKNGTIDDFNGEDIENWEPTDEYRSMLIDCHCPYCDEYYSIRKVYEHCQTVIYDKESEEIKKETKV